METTPFVSIICTVFNKEPWLKKTIDSFLAQKTSFSFVQSTVLSPNIERASTTVLPTVVIS